MGQKKNDIQHALFFKGKIFGSITNHILNRCLKMTKMSHFQIGKNVCFQIFEFWRQNGKHCIGKILLLILAQ